MGFKVPSLLVVLANASAVLASCAANSSADYVIVGGGTAGVALGTRLSNLLPNDCILILEAGPDGRSVEGINVPGLKGSTFNGPLDWAIPTVPQAAAYNRTINHNRGKVLGGTSALNLMVWDRSTVREYDAWEELGNPGWNFKNMYPAMLKAENFQRKPDTAPYGQDGVAYGGPVQAGTLENPPPHLSLGVAALKSLGVQENLESLNGSNIGTMFQPASQRYSNHTRSYAVEFLPRAGSNLVLQLNTTVHKITLDESKSKATGVLLLDGTTIAAKKELILAAGALLSPKILELSGIGQKAVLDKNSIEQLVDLPGVGENLQDHLRIQTVLELKPDILGLDILKYNTTAQTIELDKWRRGVTSLYQYVGSAYGFLKWDAFVNDTAKLYDLAKQSYDKSNSRDRKKFEFLTKDTTVPDVEIIFSDGLLSKNGYPKNGTAGFGMQYVTIIGSVQHPLARGTVHINGSDPANKPLVDPRYISNAYDFEALKTVAKFTRQIAQTSVYKDVWVSEFNPGEATQTDAQWADYVRDNVFTLYHPLGTCPMLPKKDGGVVDSHLKVYGIEKLRIVDGSIIPIVISAHIQTAIYGIAERAANMIAHGH